MNLETRLDGKRIGQARENKISKVKKLEPKNNTQK